SGGGVGEGCGLPRRWGWQDGNGGRRLGWKSWPKITGWRRKIEERREKMKRDAACLQQQLQIAQKKEAGI
nr:hypothetical protein [Tanacetum cinerariifolium]